ncbi:BURP domain-containing protein BNM2A [Capsicum chacoense]
MDLKFYYCFLSLILLVAYGTEARKVVQGNSEDGNQQALKAIYGSEDNHQQSISGNGKLASPFIFYKQDNDEQVKKENQHIHSEDNHQQALKAIYGAEDNHQQEISGNKKLTIPFFFYKQANDEQVKKENEHIHSEHNHQQEISGNKKLAIPFFFYKQANDEQVKKENEHIHSEHNHQQEISGNKKLAIPFFFYKQANDEQVKKENEHIHSEHNHQQEISGNKKLAIPFFFYKEGNNEQVKRRNERIMHSSSHTHMDDPSIASIFFLQDDLKMGKTVTLSFQKRINLISSPSNSPQNFFPKKAADSIPFSFKELPNLLQRFSLSENSPQAKSMEDALRICELSSPITGETQYCATSAEGMLNFVHEIMGKKTQVETLSTTTHFSNEDSTPHPQNYTIVDVPQEVSAPKMVMCHILSCDYTVFYCHHTISDERKVSKVSLRNEANGDTVESIAVCHLDTSEWDPSHVSFRVLGVLPGASPICHFFPSSNDLVWVPKTGNEAL